MSEEGTGEILDDGKMNGQQLHFESGVRCTEGHDFVFRRDDDKQESRKRRPQIRLYAQCVCGHSLIFCNATAWFRSDRANRFRAQNTRRIFPPHYAIHIHTLSHKFPLTLIVLNKQDCFNYNFMTVVSTLLLICVCIRVFLRFYVHSGVLSPLPISLSYY